MAITKLALPVTGIRGTIAGVVYSANKSGTYMKGWSKGSNPGTPYQLSQRVLVSETGTLWRSLSTADQADWDALGENPPEIDYNSLGEVIELSGFAWFSRILLRRRRCGLPDDLIAPLSAATDPPDTFSLTLYPSTGENDEAFFEYTNNDFLAHYAILQMAIAPGLGSNVWTSRFMNLYEGLGVGATKTEFGVSYFDRFGITQETMRFFARLYRQADTGIRSTPLALFSDVLPTP